MRRPVGDAREHDEIPTLPRLPIVVAGCGWSITSFGPDTYRELNDCLRRLWGPDAASVAEGFPTRCVLEEVLREHFRQATVEERIHSKKFDCLWDLLRTIKYTGTQGRRSKQRPFTRADVLALEQTYRERFGGIVATYQVFYGLARGCARPARISV